MSTKKRKETAEKKNKKNKSKKISDIKNSEDVSESEISQNADKIDVLSDSSDEELLKKERVRAQNMEDRYLRVNAEFENYKKRMIRESTDRTKFFNLDLIKELLPSLDNLGRAINHAKNENLQIAVCRPLT